MLYFLLFNIAPTVVELVAVAVIFYLNFGWGLVVATLIAVVLYICGHHAGSPNGARSCACG